MAVTKQQALDFHFGDRPGKIEVTPSKPCRTQRDLSLALRAAKKAYEASEGKTAAITETYARALFETDSLADAVKYQQEAVSGAQKPEEKADYEKTLASYKQAMADKKKTSSLKR
jgi:hypothetical protein